MNDAALNPPSLAAAINAKGFSGAAGFRIVAVGPGSAEVSLPRRPDLVLSGSIGVATVEVFSKNEATETLCAFCTATMRALDLPAEFR